jgi:hypothetical protein
MKKILFFLLIIIAAVITSCRKTPNFDQLSYQFIVSTNLDKTANFGNYKTFYISDTIVYVGGVGDDSILVGSDADLLVNTVKDNLTARGYTFVSRASRPDLGFTLTAIKDINVIVDYYPGWWDPYWGYCYWYYYCYPPYYGWSTIYTYTTGTIILNMYDLKNADHNQQIQGLWNTTALGALGSDVSGNVSLGVNAINQGFEQSPYIQTN